MNRSKRHGKGLVLVTSMREISQIATGNSKRHGKGLVLVTKAKACFLARNGLETPWQGLGTCHVSHAVDIVAMDGLETPWQGPQNFKTRPRPSFLERVQSARESRRVTRKR